MSNNRWNPRRPYNSIPLLPPEADVESKAVLRRCIIARAALAELKQAGQLIPNPSVLINTLPLLEARASSEIENIVTTMDRLFQYLQAQPTADPATKEALRYRQALMLGFHDLRSRPLSTGTAETVCTRIRGVEMRVRNVPGTRLMNDVTGEVIYTPPEGESVIRALLANWEQYLHLTPGPDPLIRMAVAHYQFEAIHPFTDGNGRTGRVLNSLFLVHEGLLTMPILYLSRYIVANKSTYYQLLHDVTRAQAWQPWVEFMLDAVAETSTWTTDKIAEIQRLFSRTASEVQQMAPKIYSHELITVLFEQPYCRIQNLVDKGIAKRETASRYLHRLAEIGILQTRQEGRDKLFVNPRLMDLLVGDTT